MKRAAITIDFGKLGKELGCEVVPVSALKGNGVKEAAEKAVKTAKRNSGVKILHSFDNRLEEWLSEIEKRIGINVPDEQKRFYAIKLFEGDNKIRNLMNIVPACLGYSV